MFSSSHYMQSMTNQSMARAPVRKPEMKALVSSSKISARSEKRPPLYPARLSSSGMLSFCKKILRGITGMEMSG